MISNLLILCVGNICRSPLAEAMFAKQLFNISPQLKVHSAGVAALIDHPADALSQKIALTQGLDLSNHRARQLTQQLAFESDLILTMTRDQKEHVENYYPEVRGRVHRLGKWGGFDVPDPFKRPKEIFYQALALIEEGMNDWCRKLWI